MVALPKREFPYEEASRQGRTPLLIGLMGPSGSGKTYSALRLATGISQVTGDHIHVIDTETRRALHYADLFKFRHTDFTAPYSSLDYLVALKAAVAAGSGIIVVDSMSHEHIGEGGYLETWESEIERMAGNDYAKRERVKFAGLIRPARMRSQLITGLLQLNAHFIFCFRAKEKIKPVPGGQPVELGWMPQAGDEFIYEMTTNLLLLPKSGGVPTWQPGHAGEKQMIKSARQFEDIFREPRPLDEKIGADLARWAGPTAPASAQRAAPPGAEPKADANNSPPSKADIEAGDKALAKAAQTSRAALKAAWHALSPELRVVLRPALDRRHLPDAHHIDPPDEGA